MNLFESIFWRLECGLSVFEMLAPMKMFQLHDIFDKK